MTQSADFPQGLPLTYPDLVDILDMDPYASETTSDLQNLTQDVFHVLKQRLGTNPDDPTRGVGAEDYLSADTGSFYKLSGLIDSQLKQDDRITASNTTITQEATGAFTIRVNINVSGQVVPLQFGFLNGNFSNLTP